jgi:hypothetical protein
VFLKKIIRRVRGWLKAPPRMISEERDLHDDMERLDREQPGWDRDGRIAGAQAALQRGMDREVVLSVYGEEILQEAERRNAGHT